MNSSERKIFSSEEFGYLDLEIPGGDKTLANVDEEGNKIYEQKSNQEKLESRITETTHIYRDLIAAKAHDLYRHGQDRRVMAFSPARHALWSLETPEYRHSFDLRSQLQHGSAIPEKLVYLVAVKNQPDKPSQAVLDVNFHQGSITEMVLSWKGLLEEGPLSQVGPEDLVKFLRHYFKTKADDPYYRSSATLAVKLVPHQAVKMFQDYRESNIDGDAYLNLHPLKLVSNSAYDAENDVFSRTIEGKDGLVHHKDAGVSLAGTITTSNYLELINGMLSLIPLKKRIS